MCVCMSVPKDLSVCTDEPLSFFFQVGFLIGSKMVFCYLIILNKSGYGFRLFFFPFHIPSNIEPLDAKGARASYLKRVKAEKLWCYSIKPRIEL